MTTAAYPALLAGLLLTAPPLEDDAAEPGPDAKARVAALEAAHAGTPADGLPPDRELTERLAKGLEDDALGVRITAAELLQSNQDPEVAVPALAAALDEATAEIRRVIVKRVFVLEKGGKVVDLDGRPVHWFTAMLDDDDAAFFLAGTAYGHELLAAIAHHRCDPSAEVLEAFLDENEPDDTPGPLLAAAAAGLARVGTRPAIERTVEALEDFEKWLRRPDSRRPRAYVTPHNSLTNITAKQAHPLAPGDREAVHEGLTAAFTALGAERLPEYDDDRSLARAWKRVLIRERRHLPDSLADPAVTDG